MRKVTDAQVARLVALLAEHRGRARGINVDLLAAKLQTNARETRRIVSEARDRGVAICALPESGYFVADTAEELEHCCQFLRARALHSLHLESRLRNIPLPELLGQLHLRT